jgi:3-carboxy-cis,cis-muconate cycloisomerase
MPDQNAGTSGSLFGGVFARSGAIIDDRAWLQAMLDTEAGLARALERAGLAPAGAGEAVTRAARAGDFDIAELGELSALTGNPVPGLARALAIKVGGQPGRAVHRGATSQDILDTAAMLLARRAIDAAHADLAAAAAATAALATEHRTTPMIGRTLLQQAVPVTFGVVAAGWLAGLDAAITGLAETRRTRLAVQFGGAAGTLASLGPDGIRVKAMLADELELADPPLPWHTERLRIIDVGVAMARVTAALSKIARDVTLLAQTEVAEVAEGGGSSALPSNSSPVAAVAILGCAKQAPGLLATLVASAEQEHQRAAGAWHAEWQPFGHLLQMVGSAASWGRELLANLEVDTGKMAANLTAAGGLPLAERVSALLRNAIGAAEAHDLVATSAAKAATSGVPLRDILLADPDLEDKLTHAGITQADIEQALDPAGYLGAAADFTDAALAAHEST